ncbi:16S rRNA (uracil(1498)-N(3))-methyltransferase [Rhizorhabdus dicambivorans]|uniref:Ribosomal RNA small subunit methyltransferase E n=1 Tax=Rhizorhabdus dicambivorans TaxID=1850238 RepID=A0A2A4FU23_9SPHN|nr:16S rRNA (uracil(1498)-N(3))-methyltransferase [Rhizorhabdus dicambivorans]ATE67553.1 16S rRNA (uracil(1498)-N(3))-methyltransferase [Rhizorhabdus dicambivorans]PCE42267.1 16S rRNA (uracil(1498)-N(3))-methyltransferase [Rhizorhabdus dicambivorans]
MAQTPAWPPASLTRLFVDQPLADGITILIEGGQAHYLSGVMRLKAGDAIALFDDVSGEWRAEIEQVAKRHVQLRVTARLREREDVPDLWLVAAPIKKGRIDWVAEKACELGVARWQPVITHRTIVDKLNLDRLRAHMIEAAEQCERTALPILDEPMKLAKLLGNWPAGRALIFADEEGGVPMAQAVKPGPAAILIGPEGGFTDEERSAIKAVPQAVGVSLGPRILRADTAMAAAVSLWMGLAGDWR